ncbi:pyruvoyl-dependent arginine decarboxylase [Haloparvum sp. AD34]
MSTIHVASGVGVAPTEMAAYDAALADANLHNYNLVTVSSIVPADADVEQVDTAPDLGPAGNRLTVVQARDVAEPGDDVDELAAGLGWATGPGPGLFYEVSGGDRDGVRAAIHDGLDAGAELRDWELTDRELCVESAEAAEDAYTCVIVLAAYGDSEPIL